MGHSLKTETTIGKKPLRDVHSQIPTWQPIGQHMELFATGCGVMDKLNVFSPGWLTVAYLQCPFYACSSTHWRWCVSFFWNVLLLLLFFFNKEEVDSWKKKTTITHTINIMTFRFQRSFSKRGGGDFFTHSCCQVLRIYARHSNLWAALAQNGQLRPPVHSAAGQGGVAMFEIHSKVPVDFPAPPLSLYFWLHL